MEAIDAQIIEEKDIKTTENINQNTKGEKAGCKSCKKKGISHTDWLMIILSSYILFSSVYGTIKLIKELMLLF
jgi:hypothetical protein